MQTNEITPERLLLILFAAAIVFYSRYRIKNKGQQKSGFSLKKTFSSLAQSASSNSSSNSLNVFLNDMLRICAKRKFQIVAPGTVAHGGNTSQVTAFFVSDEKIAGIICYGFGGLIVPKEEPADWEQVSGAETNRFENPLLLAKEQHALVRAALLDIGIEKPLELYVVFTNRNCTITKSVPGVLTREAWLRYLKENYEEGTVKEETKTETFKISEAAGIQKLKKQKRKH